MLTLYSGWGWEGGSPGETGEERAGSGSPYRWRELGEIEKVLQHFVIFRNRNVTKIREPLRKGAERGRKSYGKRE